MTPALWLVAALLVTAATVVAWPVRDIRRRRRALFGVRTPGVPAPTTADGSGRDGTAPDRSSRPGRRPGSGPPLAGRPTPPVGHAPPVPAITQEGERPGSRRTSGQVAGVPVGGRVTGPTPGRERPYSPRPPGRRDSRRPVATLDPLAGAVPPEVRPSGRANVDLLGALGRRLPAALRAWTSYSAFGAAMAADRVRALVLVGVVAGLLGATAAGPVGGTVLAGYGVLGARAALGRRAGRLALRERRRRLDQLSALAADLRAGRPVPELSTGDVGDADRFTRLTRAAVRLADRTGAPLAELLERIEADARSLDRGLAAASAQAAGARATALLLAALPLGGIGLGYGIGADPLSVLLHTPLGAACAVTAMGLQVVGLLWAERLGRSPAGDG